MVLYLFSGANEGYTLRRAVKEAGGDDRKVLQIDVKNGSKWDMVEGPLYKELLKMAVNGQNIPKLPNEVEVEALRCARSRLARSSEMLERR